MTDGWLKLGFVLFVPSFFVLVAIGVEYLLDKVKHRG